jgi:hypothetical protein
VPLDHRAAAGARIREHLGQDPKQLASTGADFEITDHPNLQLVLDSTLPNAELVGFSGPPGGFMVIGFSALVGPMAGSIELGSVQYTDVEVGDGRVIRCVFGGPVADSLGGGASRAGVVAN